MAPTPVSLLYLVSRELELLPPAAAAPFSLSLFLSVSPNFDHTFTVTIHAIDSLTRLGEDELVDTVLAYFTLETVGMVRVVTSHNGLVENGQLADIAVV